MRGPYRLTPITVDIRVPDKIGGVYGLGKDPKKINVVARTDEKLRDAIKGYWKLYDFFWFEPALSKAGAHKIHCQEYHKQMECGDLEDKGHPAPHNQDVKCPECGE